MKSLLALAMFQCGLGWLCIGFFLGLAKSGKIDLFLLIAGLLNVAFSIVPSVMAYQRAFEDEGEVA